MGILPLGVATTVGLVCVWRALYTRACKEDDRLARERHVTSAIRTTGALVWPVLLLSLIHPTDRGCGYLAVPLLWMEVMWAIDLYALYYCKSDKDGRPASLRLSAGSVTAFAFGLSGLIGASSDSRYVHFFLLSIMGCVMTVLPDHNFEEASLEATVMENVQRTILMWCIGLMVSGVVLTRAGCGSR